MRKFIYGGLVSLLLLNIIACNHAWRFTHFSDSQATRTKPEQLSFGQKAQIALFGIPNAKPINHTVPDRPYEIISLQSQETLEAWYIEVPKAKGVVAIFHGYTGCKDKMLNYAEEFHQLGYSTFLLDFMGSGGSTGNQTTIGYKESRDVNVTVDYLKQRFPNERLILLGESMGAVAIMKAMSEKPLAADQLILHCPFGYMKKTTEKRFEAMGLPSFALADILLAYGGLLNGFNAFQHNPVDYAKTIQAPTLLLWGAKDARVTRAETAAIFSNLQGEKKLNTFEHSGHENYLIKHREEWRQSIKAFITQN